jgi:C-terminal processing protease CtpA/Prc
VRFAKDGEKVFVLRAGGRIARVELESGKVEPVAYEAEMTVRAEDERAYIFEHAWRQLRRKFYDPALHGTDWDALKAHYGAFLPHIRTNHDFAELLSEMLGELNASHTGAYHRIQVKDADETASLGLIYDPSHAGDGLAIADVLEDGPCDRAGSKIVPGTVLTHLDGVALTAQTNPWRLLDHRADRPTRLAFTLPDGSAAEEVVKPISRDDEEELRYRRWVLRCRAEVERLSGGRAGYVHVRSMDEDSFREVYADVLGRYADKEALVVDTRWNGGGWLHDDLVTFLGGRRYAWFQPRGKERGYFGGEPSARWAGPVVVIQNESNYSDAHVFPWAFQELGLGKLVGTPVAGTGTAVWWERQIDPSIVFGIPQVGLVTTGGRYLENLDLRPDVEVVNDPESRAAGRDLQLERAVAEAVAGIGK